MTNIWSARHRLGGNTYSRQCGPANPISELECEYLMERSFVALTEAERRWIFDELEQAREFVRAFAPEVTGDLLSLESLDEAFSNLIKSDNHDGATANASVIAVGVAFGNKLVERLGFNWVIVTDEYGTDLGVLSRPGRGDVTIIPTDFVAKRYERKEWGFLESSFADIECQLREIAVEWGEPA
jgi:hypothetical protein